VPNREEDTKPAPEPTPAPAAAPAQEPVVGDYPERPYAQAVTAEHRAVLEEAGQFPAEE
jgi:hypothetical protein